MWWRRLKATVFGDSKMSPQAHARPAEKPEPARPLAPLPGLPLVAETGAAATAVLPAASLSAAEASRLHPLALAYVGDAVYDLFVRSRLVEAGHQRPGELHQRAVRYVRARAQAMAVRALLPRLSQAERAVVRRGRNARPGHLPKGASVAEYHLSSGFEALVGYLYLSGQAQRLTDVLRLAAGLTEDDGR